MLRVAEKAGAKRERERERVREAEVSQADKYTRQISDGIQTSHHYTQDFRRLIVIIYFTYLVCKSPLY